MTDPLITPAWARDRDACYADDRLRSILGDGLTAAQLLDREDVSASDRVWAVSQWLPEPHLMAFIVDTLGRCFQREANAGRMVDPRSVAVLTALRDGRWPTEAEVKSAEAARAAAWDAADVAGAARAAECQAQVDCLRRLVRRNDRRTRTVKGTP